MKKLNDQTGRSVDLRAHEAEQVLGDH
jgi:hypothetical protein